MITCNFSRTGKAPGTQTMGSARMSHTYRVEFPMFAGNYPYLIGFVFVESYMREKCHRDITWCQKCLLFILHVWAPNEVPWLNLACDLLFDLKYVNQCKSFSITHTIAEYEFYYSEYIRILLFRWMCVPDCKRLIVGRSVPR